MLAPVRRTPVESLLLGTVLLWSFNFTATRYGVTNGFQPIVYAALRWAIAGFGLALVAQLRGRSLWLGRRDLVLILVASVIGVVINQIAFSYSLRLATASTVALVFGTLPIFVSLMSQLAGHERLRWRHWLATSVSFTGVALVAAGAGGGLSRSVGGILLALVATLCFATYSVMAVPVMKRHSPFLVNATSCLIGGLVLCFVGLPWLFGQTWSAPTELAWGALLYSSLASIVLGNMFWFTAVDRAGASRSALYANLQPFLGAVFAVFVLSENLSPLQLAGGLVIASGIVLGGHISLPAPPAD
jgi:drug/metabolite transporter (DMT)-like permease